MNEAVPSGPAKGHVLSKEMYEVMLEEYYTLRGWDADGMPTAERVHILGLDEILFKGDKA